MERLARDREEETGLAGRIEELRRGIEDMGTKVGETVSGLRCAERYAADRFEYRSRRSFRTLSRSNPVVEGIGSLGLS